MVEKNKKRETKILGKGLNEIFGGDVQNIIDNITEKRTSGTSIEIPIDKLIPNPFQPRKQFDLDELNGLAQSIKENGLFTPILVKENEAGNYYIVAGERRTRAAKIAGLSAIQSIIADISDDEMQRITLIENVQREDLNPIEIAHSLDIMIKSQKLKQEEIANILGKSRSYVANLLNLLKLDQKIINGVLENKLSYGHIRPLITLDSDQAKIIYDKIINQKLSVREIEKYVKSIKSKYKTDEESEKTTKKRQEMLYVEELIRNKLKTKVKITSNEICLKYKGKEQLSRILERMEILEK